MIRSMVPRIFISLVLITDLAGCAKKDTQVVELKRYPIDSLTGIITQNGVSFDKEITADGKGTVWIDDIRLVKGPLK